MVAMASFSSVPPHIQPPIAQVPSAMREASKGRPAIFKCSMCSSLMSGPFVWSSVGELFRWERVPPRDKGSETTCPAPRALRQKLAEMLVEHAVLGIDLLAARGELLEARAEGAAHHFAGQERRLVEQRHAAALRGEVIVSVEEFLPFRPPGGGRVDAHAWALPGMSID